LDVVWDEVVMPAFDPEVPIPASYTAAFSFDASGDPTLVVCRSGQGDGFYASYWGLGSEGVPVCLVTDFGVLVHHEERLEAVGAIADLRGREHRVELPGGTLIVQLAQPDPRVVQVDLTGPAAGSVEPMLELDEETIPVAGTSHSGRRYELTFDDPVPERATFTVQYLDRLVPL